LGTALWVWGLALERLGERESALMIVMRQSAFRENEDWWARQLIPRLRLTG
jgi:hypothetical protein